MIERAQIFERNPGPGRQSPSPRAAIAAAALLVGAATGGYGANYDEAKVPRYTLPDPLVMLSGEPVTDAAGWREHRRPEVLALFERYVYGRAPGPPAKVAFKVTSVEPRALGGAATRKQVRITLTGEAGKSGDPAPELVIDLLLFVPNGAARPPPGFLGLNFAGNHTVHADPGIALARGWVRNRGGIKDNRPREADRGAHAGRWPVADIVGRGYALATAYCGDIDPDFDDGFKNGAHGLFAPSGGGGKAGPAPDEWGSIAAWAWGLSRLLDYLELDPDVDASRVGVMGFSRLGKTALWAGALDERFALVVSNHSGCGGAALSRRQVGETVKRINTSFPHWFCDNFQAYNDWEAALPLDQHLLIALAAPRPVLVCSAEEDRWADPRGEFLAVRHAGPVFRLLGHDAPADTAEPPPFNQLLKTRAGYHIRPGKHEVFPADWAVFMDFADHHLGRPGGAGER